MLNSGLHAARRGSSYVYISCTLLRRCGWKVREVGGINVESQRRVQNDVEPPSPPPPSPLGETAGRLNYDIDSLFWASVTPRGHDGTCTATTVMRCGFLWRCSGNKRFEYKDGQHDGNNLHGLFAVGRFCSSSSNWNLRTKQTFWCQTFTAAWCPVCVTAATAGWRAVERIKRISACCSDVAPRCVKPVTLWYRWIGPAVFPEDSCNPHALLTICGLLVDGTNVTDLTHPEKTPKYWFQTRNWGFKFG